MEKSTETGEFGEPWEIVTITNDQPTIIDANGNWLVEAGVFHKDDPKLARIVACVNFCRGINQIEIAAKPPKTLVNIRRDACLALLGTLVSEVGLEKMRTLVVAERLEQAIEAIAYNRNLDDQPDT